MVPSGGRRKASGEARPSPPSPAPHASRLTPHARIEIDNPLDRPPADGAERDVVAREHHAIDLRPVVALRLVHRALERADPAGVFLGREHPRLLQLLLPEESVHVLFGAPLGADLPPLFL